MKIFDTSVLIEYLRGNEAARSVLDPQADAGEACASVLSRVEIEGGMRTHERGDVARMFAGVVLQPVTDSIAIHAGELLRNYRRSHPGIGTVDIVIAATAVRLGAELLTLNVRHFPMFEGLEPAF